MKKIHFLFTIHNHQPVGNFNHIFRQAFSQAYKPFLSLLEKYPLIKTTLHYSGPLLEWMETEEPDLFARIQALVEKNQVEILGGGFYEPIFSVLREPDVLGQLNMMSGFIKQKFKTIPKGCWLPERVWDPVLPRLISAGNLSYTLLDSTLFLQAGLPPEQIHGYYVTEREGHTTALFPINMKLRYLIPFEQPHTTIEYLRYLASDEQEIAVTYADDGEKFGIWPDTYAWVYEQGWLEAFFKELEKNKHMIHMMTCSEYLKTHSPEGLLYLPTLAYEEMMEWALPAEAVTRYEDMLQNLQHLQLKDKYSSFIKGGYWNNFLAKYPESNHMHKKMLLISERFEAWLASIRQPPTNGTIETARRELYKGQCNCAYWHGLFGGIYLNYLRHAVYEHLIQAEKIIDTSMHADNPWIEYKVFDFKKDRSQDILISGKNLNAYFSPRDGGSLFELDFKPCSFNIANTLTRKMEGYHRRLKLEHEKNSLQQNNHQPVSIHDMTKVKEAGLQNRLIYDWYQRYSYIDHFVDEHTTSDAFSMSRYSELGDFVNRPYSLKKIEQNSSRDIVTFVLARKGFVLQNHQEAPIYIEKNFHINDSLMEIRTSYNIVNCGPTDLELCFGVEFNLTLLADEDQFRYFYFPENSSKKLFMNTKRDFMDVASFGMKDTWNGFGVSFSMEPNANIWMFPIETVSQSEEGLERTYQGSTLLLHWKTRLAQGQEQKRSIKLCLQKFIGENEKKI